MIRGLELNGNNNLDLREVVFGLYIIEIMNYFITEYYKSIIVMNCVMCCIKAFFYVLYNLYIK
jgi:hypothetical protein